MTGQELLDLLRFRLGKRTSTDLPDVTMLLEINELVKNKLQKAATLPWFLQDEDVTISTVASTEYIALPSDFLAFDDDDEWSEIAYRNTTIEVPDQWVKLENHDFNAVRKAYRENVSGKPEYYGLVGLRAYLRPIPDAIYNIRFRFYAADSAITASSGTTLWLTHASDLLIAQSGYIFGRFYLRDPEVADSFTDDIAIANDRILRETIARREAGKSRQMGE